jgi:hypothetical protein
MTSPGGAKAGEVKARNGAVVAAWALNILGVLIAVWSIFEYGPFPWSVVLCPGAMALAVGLSLALPNWFGMFSDKRPGAQGLATLLLAPPLGLITAAAFGVKLLHLSSDLIPAIVGVLAGGAGAGLWWWRFRGNWRSWPLMSLLGLLTACAVFEEVDTRMDRAAPQLFKVPVTDQHVTHGRRSTSYFIDLPAWGPRQEPDSVEVSPDVYDDVAPGQIVCVVLHPGFLGARWFTVGVCPMPPAQAVR